MERIKPIYPEFKTINKNTAVFGRNIGNLDIENFRWTLTEKVGKRLKINLLGLNGLSTIIVTPNSSSDIKINDAINFLSYSNQVNQSIGLPHTSDLIVRTSATRFFALGNLGKTRLSEASLLIMNVSENPKFKIMTGENNPTTIDNIEHFTKSFKNEVFFLVHDDNLKLQTAGVHGAINVQNGTAELFVRTGSLHARDMGDPASHYPTIRINTSYTEDLFNVNPSQIELSSFRDLRLFSSRMSIKSSNCDGKSANYLARVIRQDKETIMNMHRFVQEKFGEKSTTEFRIYTNIDGGIGRRVHVLDVN